MQSVFCGIANRSVGCRSGLVAVVEVALPLTMAVPPQRLTSSVFTEQQPADEADDGVVLAKVISPLRRSTVGAVELGPVLSAPLP
ncbi:hypothetical protein I6F26_33630 [Ensifer sp. IC3342]|nr:hypothetical protein [Ensifer sp. BRP08]MCA1451354.1 hypothetical protein [Ensifer sp. IC3342]